MLRLWLVAALIVAGSWSNRTLAQNYPSKPVHIITGVTAGSTVDIIARTLGG